MDRRAATRAGVREGGLITEGDSGRQPRVETRGTPSGDRLESQVFAGAFSYSAKNGRDKQRKQTITGEKQRSILCYKFRLAPVFRQIAVNKYQHGE